MHSSAWRKHRRCAIAGATLLLATTALATDARGEFSSSVTIASDYAFRGISQTMGSAALQASLDVALPSGVYAYAWGSNVDFAQGDEADDSSSHEINLAMGYATPLGDDWELDLQLVRYIFPGVVQDASYDYNELIGRLTYEGRHHVAIAYTGDVDDTGQRGVYYEAGSRVALPRRLVLSMAVGYSDLDPAYDASYSFLNTRLERPFGNAVVSLDHIGTFGAAGEIYGRLVSRSRLVVAVHFAFD